MGGSELLHKYADVLWDGPKIVITKVTRQRLPLNITYNRMKQNVFAMKILLVHVVDYGSTVF